MRRIVRVPSTPVAQTISRLRGQPTFAAVTDGAKLPEATVGPNHLHLLARRPFLQLFYVCYRDPPNSRDRRGLIPVPEAQFTAGQMGTGEGHNAPVDRRPRLSQ